MGKNNIAQEVCNKISLSIAVQNHSHHAESTVKENSMECLEFGDIKVKLSKNGHCQQVFIPSCGRIESYTDVAELKRKKKSCFVLYSGSGNDTEYLIGRVQGIILEESTKAVLFRVSKIPAEQVPGTYHLFRLLVDPFSEIHCIEELPSDRVIFTCAVSPTHAAFLPNRQLS
jgi:hypothetical protein